MKDREEERGEKAVLTHGTDTEQVAPQGKDTSTAGRDHARCAAVPETACPPSVPWNHEPVLPFLAERRG